MTRAQLVIQCAEQLLSYLDIFPGTDAPDAIVKATGIVLRYYDLGSLKGFYTILNSQDCIGLNAGLKEFERIEALAHELGHCFLHKSMARSGILSDYDLYQVSIHTEWEANLFAATVLIPYDYRKSYDVGSISSLASTLHVSEELLSLRIQCNELISKNNFSHSFSSDDSSINFNRSLIESEHDDRFCKPMK